MVELLLSVGLAVLAMVFVGYPLFKPRAGGPVAETVEDAELEGLLSQRESVYATIAELDADYAMGNLSAQDYRELMERYRRRALSLLKAEDMRAGKPARPKKSPHEGSPAIPARPTGAAPAGQGVCPECGGQVEPGDQFCPRCGASVTASLCLQCGVVYERGDRFCASCGSALPGDGGG